jgi:hypothetical protein
VTPAYESLVAAPEVLAAANIPVVPRQLWESPGGHRLLVLRLDEDEGVLYLVFRNVDEDDRPYGEYRRLRLEGFGPPRYRLLRDVPAQAPKPSLVRVYGAPGRATVHLHSNCPLLLQHCRGAAPALLVGERDPEDAGLCRWCRRVGQRGRRGA